jgi:hypothetical protein
MHSPILWRMRLEYLEWSQWVRAAGEYSVEGSSLTVSSRRARMNMGRKIGQLGETLLEECEVPGMAVTNQALEIFRVSFEATSLILHFSGRNTLDIPSSPSY